MSTSVESGGEAGAGFAKWLEDDGCAAELVFVAPVAGDEEIVVEARWRSGWSTKKPSHSFELEGETTSWANDVRKLEVSRSVRQRTATEGWSRWTHAEHPSGPGMHRYWWGEVSAPSAPHRVQYEVRFTIQAQMEGWLGGRFRVKLDG